MPRTRGGLLPESSETWTRRRTKLHGQDVGAWFTARGWAPADHVRSDRHAFVDEMTTPALTARRVWHTPLRLASASEGTQTTSASILSVWLQADGDLALIDASGADLQLPAGSAYFHRERPLMIENTRPTARVEISLTHSDLDIGDGPHLIDRPDSPVWVALTSLVNSVLNADHTPDVHTLSLFALSIETLTEALWAESAVGLRRPAAGDTFARALELIGAHASDPSFTVASLAARLGVTRTHLNRVFRDRGTMPSRALKYERLVRARRMLTLSPHSDLEAIAAACGFSSVRLLRESLRGIPSR